MKRVGLILLLLSAASAQAQVRVLSNTPQTPDVYLYTPVPDPMTPLGKRLQQPSMPKVTFKGDKTYTPQVGQPGKDVIWVPTPETLIRAMLKQARVKPSDFVVDLGSGDGRISIMAAKEFGARSMGIEYNPDMVALSRRNAKKAGVSGKVTFVQGDIFEADFSKATVITMYLLPSLNTRLKSKLIKMAPGTQILSHAFTMGEWQPDRTIHLEDASGYYWVVPANVAGDWAFEVNGLRFATGISQKYQQLGITSGSHIRQAHINGKNILLTMRDGRTLQGDVHGDEMAGDGWLATRIRRNAP